MFDPKCQVAKSMFSANYSFLLSPFQRTAIFSAAMRFEQRTFFGFDDFKTHLQNMRDKKKAHWEKIFFSHHTSRHMRDTTYSMYKHVS